MKYVSGRIVRGIYTWLDWSGESGRANRKCCARAGRLAVQQVVEGGRVYISACAGGITVVCWMAVSSL